uniref:ABI gene family member 3 isoform X1 n=1 Tax=Sus scrofa TaxID=9823 RepID=A0A480IYT3_PIG
MQITVPSEKESSLSFWPVYGYSVTTFSKYASGIQLGSSGPKPGGGGGGSPKSSTSRGGGGGRSRGRGSSGAGGGRDSSSSGGGSRKTSEAAGGGGGGAACPLTAETPPTPSALPAEAREEAEEAAESLPLGTTGGCTGSGIRGALLGVEGKGVSKREGCWQAGGRDGEEVVAGSWQLAGGSLAPGLKRGWGSRVCGLGRGRLGSRRGLTRGWRRRVRQAP